MTARPYAYRTPRACVTSRACFPAQVRMCRPRTSSDLRRRPRRRRAPTRCSTTRPRHAYKRRLETLDAQIADAESAGDPGAAEQAHSERQALIDALARAYGLGRRPRRLGDANERARKTVTARIRDSMTRIETQHPALWVHLRESVVTGTLCSYRPADETRWRVGL